MVLFALLRNLVILAPTAGLGLLVARRIGLGAPYLESRLDGGPRPAEPLSSIVGAGALLGGGHGARRLRDRRLLPLRARRHLPGARDPRPHRRPWWRSGLASFWAPFAEEIVDRLFLLSLVAWLGMLGMKLFRPEEDADAGSRSGSPPWRTSLFFGWYHISNEQLFAAVLPPFVALRTVLIILPVGPRLRLALHPPRPGGGDPLPFRDRRDRATSCAPSRSTGSAEAQYAPPCVCPPSITSTAPVVNFAPSPRGTARRR